MRFDFYCHCEELSLTRCDEAIPYLKARLLRHRYVKQGFLAMTSLIWTAVVNYAK
ncbi:MAG: hypothetical protein AAB740_01570 [Patescibacteria group bacterium]